MASIWDIMLATLFLLVARRRAIEFLWAAPRGLTPSLGGGEPRGSNTVERKEGGVQVGRNEGDRGETIVRREETMEEGACIL